MSEKSKSHVECSLSDIDLFSPVFIQSDIERGYYEEIYPITKLEDNGPIEFSIKNSTDKFLDLANTYMKVKFKILNADNTNIGEAKATVINYPIATLFSQVDVTLGDSIISSSTNTYAYRSFIETLLNYGKDAKESQLTLGLYTKDTSEYINETDPAGQNIGLTERFSYCQTSKEVNVIGRIHSDLFNQGRLILNALPLKIALHRQKDSFSIISSVEQTDVKIRILDVMLCLRKVQLTTSKFKEVQMSLERMPATYPINRVEVKTHSIAQGIMSLNWDNAILGQVPNRVFIGMIDNDGFTGNYKKNPFRFRHYDISSVAVYVNGESQPSHPMKLNFTNGDYLEGYRSLFTTVGKINRDEGIAINRKDYPMGYTLFGFDLSPALCYGEHQEVERKGSVRINLEFRRALPRSITVILFGEFDNQIKVNKVRNVVKDY